MPAAKVRAPEWAKLLWVIMTCVFTSCRMNFMLCTEWVILQLKSWRGRGKNGNHQLVSGLRLPHFGHGAPHHCVVTFLERPKKKKMYIQFISTNIYLQSPREVFPGVFPSCFMNCFRFLCIFCDIFVFLTNDVWLHSIYSARFHQLQGSPFFPLKCRVKGKWTVTSGGTYVNSQPKCKK